MLYHILSEDLETKNKSLRRVKGFLLQGGAQMENLDLITIIFVFSCNKKRADQQMDLSKVCFPLIKDKDYRLKTR